MSDEQMTLRETTGQNGTVALSSAAIDASSTGPQSATKQYPVMPQQPVPGKAKEPDFAAYGADGVTIFSGIIDILSTGEYNPDFDWQKAVEIFDTMRRNDAQIAMLLRLVEMPIIRAKWSIKPGEGDTAQSTEIAGFIDECLFKSMCYTTRAGRQAYQTWPEILHHILMMIAYGFSPFEVCYKKEDGWVKWARWTPLLPRTLYRWWVDEGNDLTGIQIWTWVNYVKQYINIPADKLLLFVNEQEGNNFQGVSMLRAAYKHWYYKDRYYAIEAIGVERAAVQPPVIHLSPNPTPEEQALAQTIVQNIRVNEQMGLVLKHDMDAEILKGSQRQAFQTQPIIQHHDMLMARAFLAQFANLGSNETGSYALAQSQVQMFLASFQSVIDYICSVINREIRRLVIWNYGEQENYPELIASKLIAQDITTLTDAWKSLQSGNAPLITPSPELEEHMLDLLGLPISKTHSIATTNPSSPTTPQRPDQNPDDHGDEEPDIQKQMREATDEARLLREALSHLDAVERGIQFFNPYHDARGRFTGPGGSGGGGGVTRVERGQGRTIRANGRRQRNPDHPANQGRGHDAAGHSGGSGNSAGGASGHQQDSDEHEARLARVRERIRQTQAQIEPMTREMEEHFSRAQSLRDQAHEADQRASDDRNAAARAGGGHMTYEHHGPMERVAESIYHGGTMVELYSGTHGEIQIEANITPHNSGRSDFYMTYDGRYSMYALHHATNSGSGNSERISGDRYLTRDEVNATLHRMGIANEIPRNEAVESRGRTRDNSENEEAENEAYRTAQTTWERDGDTAIAHTSQFGDVRVTPEADYGYRVEHNGEVVARHLPPESLNAAMGVYNMHEYGDNAPSQHVAAPVAAHDPHSSQPGDLGGDLPFRGNNHIEESPEGRALRGEAIREEQQAYALRSRIDAAHSAVDNEFGQVEAERSGAVSDFHAREVDMAHAQEVFGREVSARDLEQMTGARPGDVVRLSASHGEVRMDMRGASGAQMDIQFQRINGKLIAHVGYATSGNTDERTASSGKQIIDAMDAMRRNGVDQLRTTAAGSGQHGLRNGSMNGYRTWMRLGFKGRMSDGVARRASQEFGEHITRVEQMNTSRARRTWWNEHGQGFDAKFDFHDPYCLRTLAGLHHAAHRNDTQDSDTMNQGGE